MTTHPVSPAPRVVFWFKICASAFAAFNLIGAGVSVLGSLGILDQPMNATSNVMRALLLVLCLPLFIAYVVPFLFRPRPWLWTYDLVLICLSMTGILCLPIGIPLLIHWLKPETRAYFRKRD